MTPYQVAEWAFTFFFVVACGSAGLLSLSLAISCVVDLIRLTKDRNAINRKEA